MSLRNQHHSERYSSRSHSLVPGLSICSLLGYKMHIHLEILRWCILQYDTLQSLFGRTEERAFKT